MNFALPNSRSLVSLLRALHQQSPHSHSKDKDREASSSTCQLHAVLPKSVFSTYRAPSARNQAEGNNNLADDMNVDEDDLLLCVDLESFIESISIFGGLSAIPFGIGDKSAEGSNAHADELNFGNNHRGYNNIGGMAGAGTQYGNRYRSTNTNSSSNSSGSQNVSLSIVHDPTENHLVLTMQNARVKSIARLNTLQIESTPEEIIELETLFARSEIACKIIMKSIWLTHAISELDPSTDTIKIQVRQQTPHLRISSRGLAGETVHEDSDALESVLLRGYKYSVVQPALKQLLLLSSKVSLRINEEGMLSMQFMVAVTESSGTVGGATQMGHVNFVCLPDISA
ncbi:Rad1/Rec1/Rad17 [Obelidium mucronatum]|nr:Rad1/Rec1/Rad17 [Obelidium mucronatum]